MCHFRVEIPTSASRTGSSSSGLRYERANFSSLGQIIPVNFNVKIEFRARIKLKWTFRKQVGRASRPRRRNVRDDSIRLVAETLPDDGWQRHHNLLVKMYSHAAISKQANIVNSNSLTFAHALSTVQ